MAEDLPKGDFGTFDGLRKSYPQFVGLLKHAITIKLGWGFLMDAATAIKDVLLKEFEACTTAKKRTFSLYFSSPALKLKVAQAVEDAGV
jgi:hypothetical protein